MTLLEILYAAARAAGKIRRSGSQLNTSEQADGLILANQVVDEWEAAKKFAWNVTFSALTLTPAHQPHLIGPGLSSPDFPAAIRPVRIESAALILNTSTSTVDVPIKIRDDDWWANQRVKGLQSNVPTDLYYSPDSPSGALYLWPIPNYGYGLRLATWVSLAEFATVGATFTAPPAYRKAFTLTIAEEMCDWWGLQVPAGLPARANRARVALQSNNLKSPIIASADIGTGGGQRGGFNYLSGQ